VLALHPPGSHSRWTEERGPVTLASTVATAAELVTNGDFESGTFDGWTTTQPSLPFARWRVATASGMGFPTPSPPQGTYDAFNGFATNSPGPEHYTLSQTISIPAATPATLTWQDRLVYNYEGQPRLLEVKVLDPANNAVLATPYTYQAQTGMYVDTGWQAHTADLSSFSGQTVKLVFDETIPQANNGIGQAEFDTISVMTPAATDTTSPVISHTITGTRGDNDWHTTDAHLNWSVTDDDSAITTQTGCDPVDVTTDQQATGYTCMATSSGGTASQTVSIKRDEHAPDVAVTGVSNGARYTLGSIPAAGCNTQDSTSGVANAATPSLTGGPLGAVTVTCAGATDNAGNTANNVSLTYEVSDSAAPSGGVARERSLCPAGTSATVTCVRDAQGRLAMIGTGADEVIVGTDGRDRISPMGGKDTVRGNGGDDLISGGPGDDQLHGGSGHDRLNGNDSNDSVAGNEGADSISGGDGNDRLSGQADPDGLSGGPGHDKISGGDGNDRLHGADGNDGLSGGAGRDLLSAGAGDDRLRGGSEPDRLSCGPGHTTLHAEPNDRVAASCRPG
jgi:Ca2+-binding RTX toxin-like protein